MLAIAGLHGSSLSTAMPMAIFGGLMPSLKRRDMAVKRSQREIAVT